MASLVEQIYMQAQGGSAGGAGFADFLVQGRQANQRQQQIELQKQQVAAELAQLPLKQTLLQQDAQMNALKIQDVLEQRQFAIEDEKTVSTAWEWVSRDLKDKNPAGALTTWMDFAGQLPRLTQNPKFLQLRKDIETSLNIATELARIRPQGPTYQPGFGVAVNPLTGKQEAYFQTGAGSAQLVGQDVDKPLSTTGKLLADRNVAFKAGLTNDVKQYDAVLAKQAALDGFSLTTNPDGTINLTKGASQAIPTAMVTKSESQIAGAVNAIKLGSTLINRLRPEDIGLLGRGGEIVVDEGLAQIVPGVANLQRVNSRTLLKFFRSDFIKALREGDSQMSDRDRKEIEAMLPSDKVNESLPSALEKIKSATKEAAERSRFSAQRANRPLPPELLKPAELIERVKKGEITWQQATEIAKMSPFRDEFDNFVETK